MAKIGYARVSSKEQHLDRQLAALKDVDKLFTDKLSGANTNRPELQKMLAYIREGDIVMVTELDRLGRNNHDLTKIMNSIQNSVWEKTNSQTGKKNDDFLMDFIVLFLYFKCLP